MRTKLADSGLPIAKFEVPSERLSLGQWLYPVKLGDTVEESVRNEWKQASPEIKDAPRVEEKHGRINSFVKTRTVIVAKN